MIARYGRTPQNWFSYPALRKQAIVHKHAFGADEVLIEDAGSGIQLVQDLRTQGIYPRSIRPEGEKEMRM